MNSIFAALSIILAEVSLILLIICGVLIFLKVRDQRRDKASLARLTEKLKAGEADRLNVLSIKLQEAKALEGDALSAAAKEIHTKEVDFYISMMTLYAKRDHLALEGLEQQIAALADAYAKLGSKQADNDSTPNEDLTTLTAENVRLAQELNTTTKLNERLEEELAAVKKEMNQTVTEFISAFSGGREAAEAKISEYQQNNTVEKDSTETTSDANTADKADDSLEVEMPPTASEETTPTEDDTEIAPTTAASEPPEEDNNPFMSIDDSSGGESIDSLIDRAMSEDDLEINIDNSEEEVVSPETLEETVLDQPTETSSTNEIISSEDSKEKQAQNDPSAKSGEDDTEQPLAVDDIDEILANAADGTDDLASTKPDDTKKDPADDLDINDDDIDAILNDIDFSDTNALPSSNSETEKAS